jgi:DNA-binding NtrC family response regulator
VASITGWTALIISPSGNCGIEASALGYGWNVTHLNSIYQAQDVLRQGKCIAALLDCTDGVRASDLTLIERMLPQPHVGWVIAARAIELEDPRLRRLIVDHCVDYVQVPFSCEEMAYSLRHAYGMAKLSEPALQAGSGPMIGNSEPMKRLTRTIGKIARNNAPVFIFGESGVGKELAAQSIHRYSHRRDKPFIAINCGAIPPNLIQSELFGYERGAFTGANQRKIGWIEQANHGTLFLDEIGDLPLESQVSLLRFLQQGTITRLGGHESIELDIRIISATHVDVGAAQQEGLFRSDLYHRLCVLTLDIPALRDRAEDILVLAEHVLRTHQGEAQRKIRGFSACAMRAMMTYSWPGNVRELINRVRRALVMAEGRTLTAADLQLTDHGVSEGITLEGARHRAEREIIQRVIARNGNHVCPAARELNVSRVTLYRLMQKHGIRADEQLGAVEQ